MIGHMYSAQCIECGLFGFRTRELRASWAIDHKHARQHTIHIESETRR